MTNTDLERLLELCRIHVKREDDSTHYKLSPKEYEQMKFLKSKLEEMLENWDKFKNSLIIESLPDGSYTIKSVVDEKLEQENKQLKQKLEKIENLLGDCELKVIEKQCITYKKLRQILSEKS